MNKTLQVKLDNKLIAIVVLVIALLTTIGLWHPWSPSAASQNRTMTITGEATVSDTPDEFIFYPTYQETGTDRQATIDKVSAKVNTVIAEIKKLGVSEDSITLSANAYTAYWQPNSENSISVTVTVKVDNKTLAQKVQDYIITTTPSGQITSWPTFSDAKLKTLQANARTEALKDARSKADKTVGELGAALGKVISVSDNNYGGIIPMMGVAEASDSVTTKTSLPISTGKQDVTVTIQVTYELR